jgi:thiol-disulfide isomerase/thioredoxin
MQSITELAAFNKAIASHRLVRAALQRPASPLQPPPPPAPSAAAAAAAAAGAASLLLPSAHPLLPLPALAGPLQSVVHFWAAWCEPCKFLDSVLAQLAADQPAVAALRVEAEEAADISEQYNVSVVPYFLFLRDGKVVDSLEGADAAALTAKFGALAGGAAAGAPTAAPAVAPPAAVVSSGGGGGDLQARLKQLVNQKPIMLFMKARGGGSSGEQQLQLCSLIAHACMHTHAHPRHAMLHWAATVCTLCAWGLRLRAWVMRMAEFPRTCLRTNTTPGSASPKRKHSAYQSSLL